MQKQCRPTELPNMKECVSKAFHGHSERKGGRERDTDTQTEQTDRQAGRQTGRQTDRDQQADRRTKREETTCADHLPLHVYIDIHIHYPSLFGITVWYTKMPSRF